MGRKSGQIETLTINMEEMIPSGHLLRRIDTMISFDFIYEIFAPYYPPVGQPSVDPVSMFKMLLVGYLYGIKSERRLAEEIQLNVAYRWFCEFEKVFHEIVRRCVECGLVNGEEIAADESYLPANVSRNS